MAMIASIHLFYSNNRILSPLRKKLTSLIERFCNSIEFPHQLIAPGLIASRTLKNTSPRDLALRFKFTLFMLFLNIYTFIFTNDFMSSNGKLSPVVLESLGFSYLNFAKHKWFILFTSNFIHFHAPHLIVNMVMLIFFCGSLELIKGSAFAAIVYLTAMNSNIPNGIVLLPLLRIYFPTLWLETVQYVDVGASLGVIGALGGLARLLIPLARWIIMGAAITGTIISAVYLKTLFGLDHAVSAFIGYLVADYLLRYSTIGNSVQLYSPVQSLLKINPGTKKTQIEKNTGAI